jgi:hypothetical protein
MEHSYERLELHQERYNDLVREAKRYHQVRAAGRKKQSGRILSQLLHSAQQTIETIRKANDQTTAQSWRTRQAEE